MTLKVVDLNDVKCIRGHTNIGLFKNYLIDTAITDLPLTLKAICITHGHGDHFTWARTIKRRTGAKVIAPKEDAMLIENPEINVRGLFNWARPPIDMTTRFFLGDACQVDSFVEEHVFEEGITPIHLPGHTVGHTGYLCDGVFFTGDALYPEEIWEQHKLPYTIDVELTRRSIDVIKSAQYEWLVPAHGTILTKEEGDRNADIHLTRLTAIDDMLLDLLNTPRSTEELICLLLKALNIEDNLARYWLSVTTIKGHLSGLVSAYKVTYDITSHRVYWKAMK
jgi:glyoxylase-like metal-dependent hydrolase (beta-lactamase superfamily II)